MKTAVISIIIGVVVGIVVGATIVGPRLPSALLDNKGTLEANLQPKEQLIIKKNTTTPGSILSKKVTRWNVVSMLPTGTSYLGEFSKRVQDLSWRTSNGRLEIKLHEPETIVSRPNVLNAVMSGSIDAAFGSPQMWARKNPALEIFSNVPFGPGIQEFLSWLQHSQTEKIYQKFMNDMGLHGIICGITGASAGGWFAKPITTKEDFFNLRIAASGFGAQTLKHLGVKTTFLSPEKILMGFEMDHIDGAQFSMPHIDSRLGFQERAKFYYFPGWQKPANIFDLIINKKRWDKLTPTLKTTIKTVCGDNIQHGIANSEVRQYTVLKQLIQQGVKIDQFPREIMEALKLSWRAVVQNTSKKHTEFSLIWQSFSNFRRDFSIWRELNQY